MGSPVGPVDPDLHLRSMHCPSPFYRWPRERPGAAENPRRKCRATSNSTEHNLAIRFCCPPCWPRPPCWPLCFTLPFLSLDMEDASSRKDSALLTIFSRHFWSTSEQSGAAGTPEQRRVPAVSPNYPHAGAHAVGVRK